MVEALDDGADVAAGAGETDLIDEGGAVGQGGATIPFEDVAAAGIVIGQGEGERIVGLGVAFEEFFEIPGAGEGIGGGVEEVVAAEANDALGAGPFAGGGGADLHEAVFAGAAAFAGAETALAPDDGLDEGGLDAVTARGGKNGNVLAVIAPLIPPPITAEPGEEQEEEEEEFSIHDLRFTSARVSFRFQVLRFKFSVFRGLHAKTRRREGKEGEWVSE
jgi:hypothetical protein